jgi:hypothetical protein
MNPLLLAALSASASLLASAAVVVMDPKSLAAQVQSKLFKHIPSNATRKP